MSHRERVVSADGAELLLREQGEDGRPIFFWHALGDRTGLQMIEAGPVLASEYAYRVLALDAPGFGSSPWLDAERYQMPALVELAHQLFVALDLEQAV